MVVEALAREFERGLAPDYRPESILKFKDLAKKKLLEMERDGMFHIAIGESRKRKNRPLDTRAKARMREHLIEAAKNDPMLHQDIVVSKSPELEKLVKKNKLRVKKWMSSH